MHFEYGRDGRLQHDHPYISAVTILRERELAREHYEQWRAEWKKTREPLESSIYDEVFAEFTARSKKRGGRPRKQRTSRRETCIWSSC